MPTAGVIDERDSYSDALIPREEGNDAGGHEHPLSNPTQALSNTCKAIIGSGCIALADAFRRAGWIVALVGLVIMALISEYTMRQLVLCNQAIRERKARSGSGKGSGNADDEEVSFTDIGRTAYGYWGAFWADFTLLTCQFGACCAALAFITTNLKDVVNPDSSSLRLVLIVPFGILALVLTWLKSVAQLEATSGLGNTIFVFAFFITIYIAAAGKGSADCITPAAYNGTGPFTDVTMQCIAKHTSVDFCQSAAAIGSHATPTFKGRDAVTTAQDFASFFGVALYMFSAHSEVMAIEQFVQDHKGFPRVLKKAVLIAAIVYAFFGLFGYLTWGDNTGFATDGDDAGKNIGDIFQNIGNTGLAKSVKALMCFMIMCNYPLMAFGAVQMLEQKVFEPATASTCRVWVDPKRLALRTVWVLASCGVVAATDNFAFLVAFTGNFSNAVMAFTLPPMFYLKLYPEVAEQRGAEFYGCWTLTIVSACAALAFTALSVVQLTSGDSSAPC